jgi:SAM-dependent methyltransferase
MTTNTPNKHWQDFAQQWDRLGSPLRPCAQDVENFRSAMGDDPGRCLLLGVTPELADTAPQLTAIDNNADMIGALWHSEHKAVLGDWLDMPFPDASFDTLIGDGCLVLLSHPAQQREFFAQVTRVLSPCGRILLRVFVNPAQGESAQTVCADALAGNMKGIHAFKWRLSMALAANAPDFGVNVADTSTTFDRLLPDRNQLSSATGWSRSEIETIDLYRGSTARYSYPTLAAVRQTIPPILKEIDVLYGRYELAERCPILVLEARA